MPPIYVSCLAIEVFIVVSSAISPVVSVLNGSVMVVGDKVEFKCSANEDRLVGWLFTPRNSSQLIEIYLGYDITESMRPRYRIDKKISGQHNLIIESVDMAHAGIYQCSSSNFSEIGTTHLTVLDNNPECGANISHADGTMMDNSRLLMWCRVTYTGFMVPIFSWTKNNTQAAIVANTTTYGDRAVPLITTSSFITQLNSSDNGVTFSCKITFQMPNTTDRNVDIYEHTWNYTLHGPRNLTIVRNGNCLICSAYGNPTPTYKWLQFETNRTTVGPELELNVTVPYDREQIFQCTATNIFAVENKNITISCWIENKNFTISDGTSDLPDVTLETDLYSYGSAGTTPGLLDHVPIKAFVIGGPLFLLLVIIIVACVFHRRRLRVGTSNRPDVALETDLDSYDDIGLRSRQPLSHILDADSSRGRSNDSKIAGSLVYAEVKRPKGTIEEKRAMNDQPSANYADVKKKVDVNGSSSGRNGANLCEKPQPSQTPNPGNKNCIGDDGTVYAELGEMKQQPTNKVQSAKPPVFSQVEIYASIDHRGIVPPPPPKL